MLWLSAGKPVAAVAIGRLWERGGLTLDDSVAAHIPAFAAHGKSGITIRHLLTHTAGLRAASGNWGREPWETTIARICDARLEPGWTPGKKAGYHLASSWFLLGEIVRRVDGRDYDAFVRQEIFAPLGILDSGFVWPIDEYERLTAAGLMGVLQNTDGESRPNTWDTAEGAGFCRPGAGARGPARDLCRLYECLLAGGEGVVLPQTVEALTARARVGMFDHTFKHAMDWCLGFVPNNAYLGADTVRYGYGPHAGFRTFGHGGHQSSIGFADPGRRLAGAILFNGTPGEIPHDRRVRSVMQRLYETLGFAGDSERRDPSC